MSAASFSRSLRTLAAVRPSASAAGSRRFVSVEAKCVRFHRHGHPLTANVLKLETLAIDTSRMGANDVFVRMLAAPITRADILSIAGYTGKAGKFPAVGGNEGVGVVEEVGSGVKGVRKGDVVVASRPGVGTWSTHVVSDAGAWTAVPASKDAAPGSADFPIEVASVAVAAPVSARLLVEGSGLKKGDVLIQNAAEGAVGQAVVQYAAAAGIKTINIMPKADEWSNLVYHMQTNGATLVVDEDYARTPAFAKLIADLPAPAFGLNGGGSSASAVARALGANGTLVTYGGSHGRPLSLSASLFTQKNLTVKGFSLAGVLAGKSKAEVDALVAKAVEDVRGGEKAAVKTLVAREPFLDFSIALKRACEPVGRERTVVLVMPQ